MAGLDGRLPNAAQSLSVEASSVKPRGDCNLLLAMIPCDTMRLPGTGQEDPQQARYSAILCHSVGLTNQIN